MTFSNRFQGASQNPQSDDLSNLNRQGQHPSLPIFEHPTQYSNADFVQSQPLNQDAHVSLSKVESKGGGYSYHSVQEASSIHRQKTWKQKHMSGWRFSTSLFALAAAVVLIANIGIVIYCVQKSGGSANGGFKPVYTGDCGRTKTLNTVLHLVINILSSLLLTSSNYCMQILAAPNRKAIDEAHAKRRWLDIGIPSVRNLQSMSSKKRILWGVLLLTSAPLHLVYNSVFSQQWVRQAFEAALVTQSFLDGAAFEAGYTEPMPWEDNEPRVFAEIQRNLTTYQRLDSMECLQAYNKPAILDRKHVLVVTSSPRPDVVTYGIDPNVTLNDGTQNPIYDVQDFVGNDVIGVTWDWMCDTYSIAEGDRWVDECDLTDILEGRKPWSPFMKNIEVDYCLSDYTGELCTLDFSFGLMMVVCVCNFIKLICMVLLATSIDGSPLLNIGDAVSSFLESPDRTTRRMCLVTKADIEKKYWKKDGYGAPVDPTEWQPSTQRWFHAVSRTRWLLFGLLSTASILTSFVLFAIGMSNRRNNASFKEWTFGAASINDPSYYVITMGHALYSSDRLINNVLIANTPQLVTSFLFLMYNSILSAMALSLEWSSFAHVRKFLRVTAPVGKQRSTYYLSLPYRFALPLLASSTLLHWLTSQAIFLDRRTVYEVWGTPYVNEDTGSVATVGYSPPAVILVLVLGVIMVATLVALGFRRFKAGIPLAASCSAAISAACHSPANETESSVLPLKWGVVVGESWEAVGHCSFSSSEVTMPVPGNRYAG